MLAKVKNMIFEDFCLYNDAEHRAYLSPIDDEGRHIEDEVERYLRRHDILNFSIKRTREPLDHLDVIFIDDDGERIHYQVYFGT